MTKHPTTWQAALLLSLLGGVLAYTTFQWGGVVRTGRYEYLLVIGLGAVAWSLGRARFEWAPLPARRMRWAAALFPAYVLLQVVPLPVPILRVLSPVQGAAIDAPSPLGATVRFAPLSVFPAGTFQYFLLVCTYLVIFLLSRELTWQFRNSPWVMIWPLLCLAALEAGLGLWQYLGANGEQSRWGTYANHNHYAGFLEMSLPFAVIYPMALLRGSRLRQYSPVAPVLAACGVWALAGVVLAGIVYSVSRMGFISALSSLFVMGALALEAQKQRSAPIFRRRHWIAMALVTGLILAGFAFLPPEQLIRRFGNFASADGPTDEGRAGLWTETLPLIRAYPIFGCGLGGYETAFWRFKVSGVLVTDDFAHDDYLQLLAELGIAGFAILAVLATAVVGAALRAAIISVSRERRYFAMACAGALAAILLHSLTDFNLYIPANAMLLAWIAGATTAIASQESPAPAPDAIAKADAALFEATEVGSRY